MIILYEFYISIKIFKQKNGIPFPTTKKDNITVAL